MQRIENPRMARGARTPRSAFTARRVLVAACASVAVFAGLACSSEHRLGDLTEVDLGAEPGGADESTASGRDFLAPSELGPPDVTFTAWEPDYSEVVSIGDFDGDGFGDFATRNLDRTTASVSHVHIRYGGPRPLDESDEFAFAEGGTRLFSPDVQRSIEAISSVGDVDGDGLADFLVHLIHCGAPSEAYLVYGRAERMGGVASMADAGVLLSGPPLVITMPRECPGVHDPSRSFSAGLGDIDGDGFDDFVITRPQPTVYDDAGVTDPLHNVAYLFYGRADRIAAGTPWQSADARLSAPQRLELIPTGDVNADGLADLILGELFHDEPHHVSEPQPPYLPAGYFFLAGQPQRLSGDLELAPIAKAVLPRAEAAGDLDGDGVQDVLLYDDSEAPHLFYGAPGLFESGADLALADATFQPYTGEGHANLVGVRDRDGDGDDELVSRSFLSEDRYRYAPQAVAVLSGTSARNAGEVQLATPANPLSPDRDWGSYVEGVFSAGDIDGDGAGDIITRSGLYGPASDSDTPLPTMMIVDGSMRQRSSDFEIQLNVHYGTPGELAAPPR